MIEREAGYAIDALRFAHPPPWTTPVAAWTLKHRTSGEAGAVQPVYTSPRGSNPRGIRWSSTNGRTSRAAPTRRASEMAISRTMRVDRIRRDASPLEPVRVSLHSTSTALRAPAIRAGKQPKAIERSPCLAQQATFEVEWLGGFDPQLFDVPMLRIDEDVVAVPDQRARDPQRERPRRGEPGVSDSLRFRWDGG